MAMLLLYTGESVAIDVVLEDSDFTPVVTEGTVRRGRKRVCVRVCSFVKIYVMYVCVCGLQFSPTFRSFPFRSPDQERV
jgi:hypothetical protein